MRILLIAIIVSAGLAGCTTEDEYVTPVQDSEGRYIIEAGKGGNFFSPAKAVVPHNATVLFRNVGGFHNVVAEDDAFASSGEASIDAWEHVVVFAEAGEFAYYCEPHKANGMKGTILVEPAAP